MIKKVLNEKDKEIFNLAMRPFIAYCLLAVIIAFVGPNFGNMSEATADGYMNSTLILAIVNYINMLCLEIKEMKKNKIGIQSKRE